MNKMMELATKPKSDYDHDLMDSLVGKTASYGGTDWDVVDHVYNHLYMTHPERGEAMVSCVVIQHVREKNARHAKLTADNAFQRLCDERGCYKEGYGFGACGYGGYHVVVGGTIGSFASSTGGVTLDHRTVILEGYDGIQFGGQSAGYGMAHTFREDKSKPCGYYMKASDKEIAIDELPWKTIEEAKQEAKDELGKLMGRFYFFDEQIILVAFGKNESFTFFDPEAIKGYKVTEKRNTDWGGDYYYICEGVRNGKNFVSTGRSKSKWAFPKEACPLTWAEVKERIYAMQRATLDEAFRLTPAEKAEEGNKKSVK